jgi:hypothetical protein
MLSTVCACKREDSDHRCIRKLKLPYYAHCATCYERLTKYVKCSTGCILCVHCYTYLSKIYGDTCVMCHLKYNKNNMYFINE